MKIQLSPPLLALAFVCACGSSTPDPVPAPTPTAPPPAPPTAPSTPVPPTTPPAAPNTQVPAELVAEPAQHMNAFALELFRELPRKGNVAISPLSLATALHMLHEGARGDSAARLEKLLHLAPEDSARLQAYLPALGRELGAQGHEFAVANRVFVRDQLELNPAFLEVTRTRYGAPAQPLDFGGDPKGSTEAINAWAKAQTRDRITQLISATLPAETASVLGSAVYLKAQWATKFDPAQTQALPFKVAGQQAAPVPTMQLKGRYKLAQHEGVTVLELPYAGDTLVMDVVLPDAADGLASFERTLDAERLAALWAALPETPGEVQVKLPRFELSGDSMLLAPPLKKLGIEPLFDPSKADLSGIAGAPGWLVLAEVFHQVFVKVDEVGTEAAGATAVVVKFRSAMRSQVFHADHPFFFAIRDLRSSALLFVGHVVDPR